MQASVATADSDVDEDSHRQALELRLRCLQQRHKALCERWDSEQQAWAAERQAKEAEVASLAALAAGQRQADQWVPEPLLLTLLRQAAPSAVLLQRAQQRLEAMVQQAELGRLQGSGSGHGVSELAAEVSDLLWQAHRCEVAAVERQHVARMEVLQVG